MLAEKTKPAALGRHGGLRMLDRSGGLIPSLAAARAFQRRARDE
jgi:hypothetical protein